MPKGNPATLENPRVASQFITVRQLADEIGVHPKTVRKWIRSKDIPYGRIGHKIVFSRSKLEGLMAEEMPVEKNTKDIKNRKGGNQ